MNRFLYYLLIFNMFSSIVAGTPKILLDKSKNGAVTSMGLGLIAGVVVIWLLIRAFSSFPGKNLPDLLREYTSVWFAKPLLVCFGLTWYIVGMIDLTVYVDLLLRFLTPEMSVYLIFANFIFAVSIGVLMKSRNILYAMEIIIILFVPLTLFFVTKVFMSDKLDWDEARVALMHAAEWPDYTAFSSVLFVMLGVFDIVIFNSFFLKKLRFGWKEMIFVFMIGLFGLVTSYFIPIAYSGFEASSSIVYPWIVTSDSIRMKFGLIERVIFIFLINFLVIALLSIMIHWHIGARLLIDAFGMERFKIKEKNISLPFILLLFWAGALLFTINVTEYDLFFYTAFFNKLLPVLTVILLGTMHFIKRRAGT